MIIPEKLFDQILANAPSSDTTFLILSRMKEAGRVKRVIQECLRFLDFDPGAVRVRLLLAESFFDTGRLSQAEEELDKAVEQLKDLLPVYKLQARVYSKQKRKDTALKALDLYLAHHPEDSEARELRGDLEASPEITTEKAPSTGKEISMKAIGETGRRSDLQDGEDLPDIATPTLAEVYFDQGQTREAIKTYQRVVAQNPDDERSRNRLEELRLLVGPDVVSEDRKDDLPDKTDTKMIALLEGWLANIRAIRERHPHAKR
ncbi:MAG: tetratricopeptide repeat protein [Desulfatiglandales bacterium]